VRRKHRISEKNPFEFPARGQMKLRAWDVAMCQFLSITRIPGNGVVTFACLNEPGFSRFWKMLSYFAAQANHFAASPTSSSLRVM
jgi:hypothetical protein